MKVLLSGTVVAAALAILASAGPVAAATQGTAVCLTGAVKGGPDDGRPISVMAREDSKIKELKKRGFAESACTDVPPVDPVAQKNACALARLHNVQVDTAFWRRLSLTPKDLCESGKIKSGN